MDMTHVYFGIDGLSVRDEGIYALAIVQILLGGFSGALSTIVAASTTSTPTHLSSGSALRPTRTTSHPTSFLFSPINSSFSYTTTFHS
ncbi:hypothetical protein FRB94_003289 [Tulasnella sp. JGI-2019a]|nr:hypothetical protein FRB94_003289 [Tulasnella sp. JGI-2019a]